MTDETVDIEDSGFNVFAALDLPDAKAHFLKAQIVGELYRLVSARGLVQVEAGALMGISQPEVSRLFRGHFREYSVERLIAFLTAFDQDVEIVTHPRGHGRGDIVFRHAEEPLSRPAPASPAG